MFYKVFFYFKNISNPNKKKPSNKYLKILFKFLNLFLFFFIFIIFFLYLKLFSSSIEAIGHQILDIETFMLNEKNPNYKLLISTNKNHIGNSYFFKNYQNKKLNALTINNNILSTVLHYQKRFRSITFNAQNYTANNKGITFGVLKDKFRKKNFYTVREKDKKFGDIFLKNYGISENDKIILVHSRDSNYKPYDNESYRNSDINDLTDTIKYLLDLNFKVIRIGHKNSIKFKFKDMMLDLTEIEDKKKDILSIYLASRCFFFIGSSSGANTFSAIFGKPILVVNSAPIVNSLEICTNGITVPKLYKKNSKLLKFDESIKIFDSVYDPNNLERGDTFLNKNEIEVVNNSKEEILAATKEIIDKINRNDFSENNLQKKFRKLLNKSYCADALGSLSSSFLEKYKFLI